MRFKAILTVLAGVFLVCGCRRYDTAPPPCYCQPSGGCAPVSTCTPACNPCADIALPDAHAGHPFRVPRRIRSRPLP